MFYEINQYKILPGKMDAWAQMMDEEFIPFAVKQGLNSIGSFRSEDDETVYVWIRRFESDAERERVHTAVYETDYYISEIKDRLPELVANGGLRKQRIVPTPKSAMQ